MTITEICCLFLLVNLDALKKQSYPFFLKMVKLPFKTAHHQIFHLLSQRSSSGLACRTGYILTYSKAAHTFSSKQQQAELPKWRIKDTGSEITWISWVVIAVLLQKYLIHGVGGVFKAQLLFSIFLSMWEIILLGCIQFYIQ